MDRATKYQHGLLLSQKPIREALSKGVAKLLDYEKLDRKTVVNELKKPYKFVYIGSHGNDLRIRGYNRQVILTKKDANLFKGKKVYAFVCRGFESGIFDKALEAITYKGKFIFPAIGDPRFNTNDAWIILQLGFYPLNYYVDKLLEGVEPTLKEVYYETLKQYDLALPNIKSKLGLKALQHNRRAIKYIGKAKAKKPTPAYEEIYRLMLSSDVEEGLLGGGRTPYPSISSGLV